MPITLNGTTGITTPTYNGSIASEYLVPVTGFKNRIINGDMGISQRNGTSSVTPTLTGGAGTYTLDRWNAYISQASKYSVQQNAGSVTPPAGFTNYLGVTSLASTSLGADDFYYLFQPIEGFNIADLGLGTANAQTFTVSFWVRSSLTGTFGGSFHNDNNRYYPFSYTISASNTWEQKTVTVVGTTSGTWNTTNGFGLGVVFGLGVGSNRSGTAGTWSSSGLFSTTGATSVVGTNGATFYITGVQIEKGANATSFDYLPYGTELALCQRYYETGKLNYCVIAVYFSGSAGAAPVSFKQTKRTSPTMTASSVNLSPAGAIGSITGQNAYTSVDSNSWLFGVSSGAQNAVSIVELSYTASAEL
jgi:hypothetical protein